MFFRFVFFVDRAVYRALKGLIANPRFICNGYFGNADNAIIHFRMMITVIDNNRNVQSRNNAQNEYVIAFPPRSSMGLELEPVIISTNPPRQIGCRVKDYYFGMDFLEGAYVPNGNGETLWTKDYLMRTVKVGDVICKVEDERVVSKSFVEILSLLRELRNSDRPRFISFRNISSHGKKELSQHLSYKPALF